MAKDVIHMHGHDQVVREDTAKAFILIAGALFAIFFAGAAADGKVESPSQIQNTNAR